MEPDLLVERLRARPPDGGILHVAGHGLYEQGQPLVSALCLGRRFLLAHDLGFIDEETYGSISKLRDSASFLTWKLYNSLKES